MGMSINTILRANTPQLWVTISTLLHSPCVKDIKKRSFWSFHPLQFYSIVVITVCRMDQHVSHNSIQQLEFKLKSIYIIHPSSQSKYKLKVVVHHQGKQEAVKRNNTYLFRILVEKDKRGDGAIGYVTLMEMTDPKEAFLEIGRGEIQFRGKEEGNVVNGIVYGTRAFNYDRVIAKYSYKIRARLIEEHEEITKQKTAKNTIKFLHHKRKEKLPIFQYKQSILQHTKEINNKINLLTSSINSIIGEANEEDEQGSIDGYSKELLQSRAEETLRKDEYFYKYGDKFLVQLKNTFRNGEINRIYIRNIKIKEENAGKIRNFGKFGKQKSDIFLSKVTPTSENQSKRQNFMLIFYQIIDMQKIRRKILQICLQLSYNTKNTLLQTTPFYLPKTTNPIIIEGIPLTTRRKSNRLQGLIQYSYSKNRMIDFYDEREEERGYMIALVETVREIEYEYISQYQSQLGRFQRVVKEEMGGVQFARRHSTPIERLNERKNPRRQRVPIQEEYESLSRSPAYQSTKDKKSTSGKNISPSDLENRRANHSEQRTPRRSRINENRSLINKRILQQYSSKPQPRLHNLNNSNRKLLLNLNIDTIYISLYDNSQKISDRITVRFELDDTVEMRKARVGYNQMEKNPVDICFNDVDSNEILRVGCLGRSEKERYKTRVLGNCNIIAKELLKDPKSNSFRTFVYLQSKIVGFIILDFRFTQENTRKKVQIEPQSIQYDLSSVNIAEKQHPNEESDSQYQLSLSNYQIKSPSPDKQRDNYSQDGDSEVLVDQDYDQI